MAAVDTVAVQEYVGRHRMWLLVEECSGVLLRTRPGDAAAALAEYLRADAYIEPEPAATESGRAAERDYLTRVGAAALLDGLIAAACAADAADPRGFAAQYFERCAADSGLAAR
eukprot:TRINITY_DN10861_c0_g7_i1.p3 TRINITY_DN10861_c0_g7~~TRINITY_DN10861_c0_g7_i1.p3  ORF type:complete len:130 (+),score=46.93 TRINITY_DN10861_c0_g7_i1:51-392(+)